MDQLFSKYADPYFLINGYIKTHRFCSFVEKFLDILTKDLEEKYKWEFYLHKVFDKSYSEWNEANKTMDNNKNMSSEQLETTIQKSMSILQSFNPQ